MVQLRYSFELDRELSPEIQLVITNNGSTHANAITVVAFVSDDNCVDETDQVIKYKVKGCSPARAAS